MFKELQMYKISEIDYEKIKDEMNRKIADSIKEILPDIDLNEKPRGTAFVFPIRQNPLRSDFSKVNFPNWIGEDLCVLYSGHYPFPVFPRPNRKPLTDEEKKEFDELIAECKKIIREFKEQE
jgi:hypothetical protein